MSNFKLIIALSISLLVISCAKEEENKVNSSSTNNNTSINQYVGFWKLCKFQYMSAGIIYPTQTNFSPILCILNLKSTQSVDTIYYTCDYSASTCNPFNALWRISLPGFIEINFQQYYVQKLTNDSLILTKGDSISQFGSYEVYRYYK